MTDQGEGLLGSRTCIGEGLRVGEHLANSRILEASVVRRQERREIILPNLGRQSESHKRLLGFCYDRSGKSEASGGRINHKTERMNLEKGSNIVAWSM